MVHLREFSFSSEAFSKNSSLLVPSQAIAFGNLKKLLNHSKAFQKNMVSLNEGAACVFLFKVEILASIQLFDNYL